MLAVVGEMGDEADRVGNADQDPLRVVGVVRRVAVAVAGGLELAVAVERVYRAIGQRALVIAVLLPDEAGVVVGPRGERLSRTLVGAMRRRVRRQRVAVVMLLAAVAVDHVDGVVGADVELLQAREPPATTERAVDAVDVQDGAVGLAVAGAAAIEGGDLVLVVTGRRVAQIGLQRHIDAACAVRNAPHVPLTGNRDARVAGQCELSHPGVFPGHAVEAEVHDGTRVGPERVIVEHEPLLATERGVGGQLVGLGQGSGRVIDLRRCRALVTVLSLRDLVDDVRDVVVIALAHGPTEIELSEHECAGRDIGMERIQALRSASGGERCAR